MHLVAISNTGFLLIYIPSLLVLFLSGVAVGFRWRPHYDAAVAKWEQDQCREREPTFPAGAAGKN